MRKYGIHKRHPGTYLIKKKAWSLCKKKLG
jgi:hypothetical protein